jgi:polar amino acid transport system substrate-binding protein
MGVVMTGKPWGVGSLLAAAMLASASCESAEEAARPTNPYQGRADITEEGRSLLNQYCAHCHGPNADQGERPRDLRRLKIRYGDNAVIVFWTTVKAGRMDKGMPVWAGVLPDDSLWRIFTFLESVQTQP